MCENKAPHPHHPVCTSGCRCVHHSALEGETFLLWTPVAVLPQRSDCGLSDGYHWVKGNQSCISNQKEGSETATSEKCDSTAPPWTSLKFLSSLPFIYINVGWKRAPGAEVLRIHSLSMMSPPGRSRKGASGPDFSWLPSPCWGWQHLLRGGGGGSETSLSRDVHPIHPTRCVMAEIQRMGPQTYIQFLLGREMQQQ